MVSGFDACVSKEKSEDSSASDASAMAWFACAASVASESSAFARAANEVCELNAGTGTRSASSEAIASRRVVREPVCDADDRWMVEERA